jgi:hypothetical protein
LCGQISRVGLVRETANVVMRWSGLLFFVAASLLATTSHAFLVANLLQHTSISHLRTNRPLSIGPLGLCMRIRGAANRITAWAANQMKDPPPAGVLELLEGLKPGYTIIHEYPYSNQTLDDDDTRTGTASRGSLAATSQLSHARGPRWQGRFQRSGSATRCSSSTPNASRQKRRRKSGSARGSSS